MDRSPRFAWLARSALEACAAFGFGTVLNLLATVAAYAAGVSAGQIDPEWIAVAGAAGGLVSALVHIGVVSLGAEPVGRREIARAVLEGAFAVVVGAIVAGYLGPQGLRLAPNASPSDLRAFGFGIGMGAWRFAPGVFGALKLLSNPATLYDIALRWLTALRPAP